MSRCLCVCLSVCLLGTAVSPTRMAERSRDCPMSCACRPNGRSVCRVLKVVLLQTLREAIGTSLFSRIHHIVRQRHTGRLHFCSRRLENVVPVPRKSKKSNSFVLGIAAKANYKICQKLKKTFSSWSIVDMWSAIPERFRNVNHIISMCTCVFPLLCRNPAHTFVVRFL